LVVLTCLLAGRCTAEGVVLVREKARRGLAGVSASSEREQLRERPVTGARERRGAAHSGEERLIGARL